MSEGSASNEEPQSSLLKMNNDCKIELFEWLTLPDLKALRLTCKSLKEIVDHHIQSVYTKGLGHLDARRQNKMQKLSGFNSSSMCRSITFGDCTITGEVIENIKPILNNIEKVHIHEDAKLNVDLYEHFLKSCTNLKHLDLHIHPLETQWLQHQIPTIVHLSLVGFLIEPLPALQTFFHLNPNILRFSIDTDFLNANKNWMEESKLELDQLDIIFDAHFYQLVCRSLNVLFEKKVYKRLNMIFCDEFDRIIFNAIASLDGLHTFSFRLDDFIETPMPQVKEIVLSQALWLYGPHGHRAKLADSIINSFVNIERVNFKYYVRFDAILIFIRRAIRLVEIKIQEMCGDLDGTYCTDGIINMPAINGQRKLCAGASKATIYVDVNVYVKTKGAYMKTNFSLIQLKRAHQD